jgi:hypothetical protein
VLLTNHFGSFPHNIQPPTVSDPDGSFSIEPKSSDDCLSSPDNQSTWAQVIRTTTSEWARSRDHRSPPRNVGGTPKNKWTPEEDILLISAVQELRTSNWPQIAARLHRRERRMDTLSLDVARSDWTPQEDAILLQKQAQLGNASAKMREFTAAIKSR